jgi:hypothetical protein
MDPTEADLAFQMGDGVKAQGVRLALHAVQVIGIELALKLARAYPLIRPLGATAQMNLLLENALEAAEPNVAAKLPAPGPLGESADERQMSLVAPTYSQDDAA